MALLQIDAGYAAVVHLADELAEVGATLVPHPCIGKESRLVAGLHDTIGEVGKVAATRADGMLLADILRQEA